MERDIALYRRKPTNTPMPHTPVEPVEALYRNELGIAHDILFTYAFILQTYACFGNVFPTNLVLQTYACFAGIAIISQTWVCLAS